MLIFIRAEKKVIRSLSLLIYCCSFRKCLLKANIKMSFYINPKVFISKEIVQFLEISNPLFTQSYKYEFYSNSYKIQNVDD